MRKPIYFLILSVLFIILGWVIFSPASKSDPIKTARKVKCNKACQRSNDFYIPAQDYRDFFVGDSDGSKDMVYSDFDYEPFEGVRCKIIKNDGSNNYIIAGWICMYNNQLYMTNGSAAVAPGS